MFWNQNFEKLSFRPVSRILVEFTFSGWSGSWPGWSGTWPPFNLGLVRNLTTLVRNLGRVDRNLTTLTKILETGLKINFSKFWFQNRFLHQKLEFWGAQKNSYLYKKCLRVVRFLTTLVSNLGRVVRNLTRVVRNLTTPGFLVLIKLRSLAQNGHG